MKFSLSCAAFLLLVATVSSRHVPGHHGHPRPSTFGNKYVVYGDTKEITCSPRGCRSRWFQTQYYQNLTKRTPLRINTNQKNVYENIFYQRSVFNRFHEYRLDVSTNQCKVGSVSILPILHVPASFTYHGTATIEGKLCGIWQRVTGGQGRPVIFRTWYVYWNVHASPPRYEPVRYVFRDSGTNLSKTSVTRVTNWRGYNTAVSDSTFHLPSQC